MAYLKQPQRKGSKAPTKKKEQPAAATHNVVVTGPDIEGRRPSMQHDINHVAGLAGVEESLDWIARGISKLTSDDSSVGLALCQNLYGKPVQLTLSSNDYDDTMGRLVTALERIADSVSKLAGLTRPRLESWHEQDEYEPRYKDIAVDGGAAGPRDGGGQNL